MHMSTPSPASRGFSPGRGPGAKAALRPAAVGAPGPAHRLVTHGDRQSQWGWHRAGSGQCQGLYVSRLTGPCGPKGEGPDQPAGRTSGRRCDSAPPTWVCGGTGWHQPAGAAAPRTHCGPQQGSLTAGGQSSGGPQDWGRLPALGPPSSWLGHLPLVSGAARGTSGPDEVPHPSAQHPARTWPDISIARQAGGTGLREGQQVEGSPVSGTITSGSSRPPPPRTVGSAPPGAPPGPTAGSRALEGGPETPLPVPPRFPRGAPPSRAEKQRPSRGEWGAVVEACPDASGERGGASPGWPSGAQGCRQRERARTCTDPHGTRCTCVNAPATTAVLRAVAKRAAGPPRKSGYWGAQPPGRQARRHTHRAGWASRKPSLVALLPHLPGQLSQRNPAPHPPHPPAARGRPRAERPASRKRGFPTLDGSRGSGSTPRTRP